MREILSKAKRLDNGEWVEGFLVKFESVYWIYNGKMDTTHPYVNEYGISSYPPIKYMVVPETVCRYTGLTDKHGKNIWENDVVKFKHGSKFDEKGFYYRNYAVEFVNTFVTYGLRLRNKSIHFPFKQATASMHDVEVIGNVFDSPELLGAENEKLDSNKKE